jgi:ABC-type transporter Mla MlaB component
MDLEITNSNNFFTLKGSLNKQTLDVFRDEFRHIFERVNAFTISIEGISSMDRYGVNALAELHNESVAKNKSMSIIGLGCKELYNHFKSDTAA